MSDKGEIILYQDEDGSIQIPVHLDKETVWLSQAEMAELFEKTVPTINIHIQNIYKEGELDRETTRCKITMVQKEGGRDVERQVLFYNLDVIISIGYRINSRRGVQFRKWATQQIKEALLQSYHQTLELFRLLLVEPAAPNQNKAGFIYLIRSVSGHYKIGCTKDPNRRLQMFSVKLPFEIEFIHLIATANMFKLERKLHIEFQNKRMNGEWFALDEIDVQTFIQWQDDSIID